MAEEKMRKGKIAVIGAGFVGASIAYAIAVRDIAREIVLVDVDREKARGEAWDIRHGISGIGTADVSAGGYPDCGDSDLVIITAGRNRRQGEERTDLIKDNTAIVYDVARSLRQNGICGVVLVVSNPVDILTYKVQEWTGLPEGMVFGTGCMLDTSRLVRIVADYTNLGTGMVSGYVAGEHGEGQVPVWSAMTAAGLPVGEYCRRTGLAWDRQVMERIGGQVRRMGSEIIQAKGKTQYGIATCVSYLADSIINRKPAIAPVTSVLTGEHGVTGAALSVPSLVGPSGVEKRLPVNWSSGESRAFLEAAERQKKILFSLR